MIPQKATSLLPLFTAAALLLTAGGCDPIGCFDAANAGGECPAQADALPFFGDPDCGGRVESVDSEPSLRNDDKGGALCCYSITNKDPEYISCTAQ